MSTQNQPHSPTLPLAAAIATVILVIGAVSVIVLDWLEHARGRNIEDAPQVPLTLPLVSGGLTLVAAAWLVWLIRQHGSRHILTMAVAGTLSLLLITTPLLAWQAFSSERALTVISLTCDAEALRTGGGAALANCQENAVDTIVLLGGVTNDDQWAPGETTGNLTREFHDLPSGGWETMLTVDGPPDTVAVSAVGSLDNEDVRLGTFRPYMDAESGQLRWTSLVRLDADISTVRMQFYLSANPAVESASIRFDVMECSGQSIRTFDASQCSPFASNTPFVMEQSPSGPRTWRHPHVTRDGSEMVITNLEERTYVLQPDYTSIEVHTQSTDVLIIPSAMPQIEENSVVVPGQSTFEVPIATNTAELTYTIYVFPSGPTFAGDYLTGR